VDISQFLFFAAPERISSRCARAPGEYGTGVAIPGPGDGFLRARGRRFNRGFLVGMSRFLSFAAPERFSSRCARAPGWYGLVFAIPSPGDSLLRSFGRTFNRGLLVGMSRFLSFAAPENLLPVRVGSCRVWAGFCDTWPR
jgi:hypothetical protein